MWGKFVTRNFVFGRNALRDLVDVDAPAVGVEWDERNLRTC